MIISFAWTTQALLKKKKTVTRRFWKDSYAKKFKKGDIVDAYSKDPRAKGKKIAEIRITKDPYEERVEDISDEHFEREGGTLFWKTKKEFIDIMKSCRDTCWVIEFEVLEVGPYSDVQIVGQL